MATTATTSEKAALNSEKGSEIPGRMGAGTSAAPQGYAYNAQAGSVNPQLGYPPPGYSGPPPGTVQQQPGMYGQPVPGYPQPVAMAPQPGYPPGYIPPVFMPRPEPIPGVPPGLEYLTEVDQLLVHQQIELIELLTSWECANKYQIKNAFGQQVFFASEESNVCMRQCCGPQRSFILHITDNFGQEVIRITRDFKCCVGCCCFACCDACSMIVQIEAPVGQVIGSTKQQCSLWSPKYDITDADDNTLLKIQGPCCMCQCICCPHDLNFKILPKDGNAEVGRISKQWKGCCAETFSDADNFGVTFPKDLDVRMKAVLLGAVFLIDFMFFEEKKNNNN